MIIVIVGLGGGTGGGAAPVIARLAREMGILTVGVATTPFMFEGKRRTDQAERSIEELRASVDSLLVIPNQRLIDQAHENTGVRDAFRMADKVLGQAVQGMTDIIGKPGYLSADFIDVRAVMGEQGLAKMWMGEASGRNAAVEAVQKALRGPLLEPASIGEARGWRRHHRHRQLSPRRASTAPRWRSSSLGARQTGA